MDFHIDIHYDPSHGYTVVNEYHPPDIVVKVRMPRVGPAEIQMDGPAVPPLPSREHCARLEAEADEIRTASARLRVKWYEELVSYTPEDNHGMPTQFPFQECVNLKQRSDIDLAAIIKELADEGCYLLFDKLLKGTNSELVRFRRLLADLLRNENLRIRFDSDVCLPWSMLAIEADQVGSEIPFSRFLGHRHQLEQTGRPYPPLEVVAAERIKPATSLNVDTNLGTVAGAPAVRKFLDDESVLKLRTLSYQLFADLESPDLDEDLMCFWCHGDFVANGAEPPRLVIRLTDSKTIDADVINRLRTKACKDGSPAVFRPFVLLNACHAGQAAARAELEYLGKSLIGHGASGVLGPQIKIPKVFAASFGLEFTKKYVKGGATAGEIVLELARHYTKTCNNPLGLAYSLYCGLDSRMALLEEAVEGTTV